MDISHGMIVKGMESYNKETHWLSIHGKEHPHKVENLELAKTINLFFLNSTQIMIVID